MDKEKDNVECDEVYQYIYKNFDKLIKNEKVKAYLSGPNNLFAILREQNPNFSDKEIYCQSLTVLYFIIAGK